MRNEQDADDLEAIEANAVEWRRAAVELERRRDILIAAIAVAAAAGTSEYALARAAGVTRMTIRAWLGKGRP